MPDLESLVSSQNVSNIWTKPKTWYRNKSIEGQLRRDQQNNGPLTRANKHNQDSRLLILPAELRNVIWQHAIIPQYKSRQQKQRNRHCTNVFDRSKDIYPSASALLICRDVYRETRAMYQHAVHRFWSQTFLHLEVPHPHEVYREYQWLQLLPRTSTRLADDKLKMLRRLHMATSGAWNYPMRGLLPRFIFEHGTWHAHWATRNGVGEKRFIVIYRSSKHTNDELGEMLRGVQHTRLTGYYTYGPRPKSTTAIEARILPFSIDLALLQAVKAIAGLEMQQLTGKTLKAILFMQGQTRGWYW